MHPSASPHTFCQQQAIQRLKYQNRNVGLRFYSIPLPEIPNEPEKPLYLYLLPAYDMLLITVLQLRARSILGEVLLMQITQSSIKIGIPNIKQRMKPRKWTLASNGPYYSPYKVNRNGHVFSTNVPSSYNMYAYLSSSLSPQNRPIVQYYASLEALNARVCPDICKYRKSLKKRNSTSSFNIKVSLSSQSGNTVGDYRKNPPHDIKTRMFSSYTPHLETPRDLGSRTEVFSCRGERLARSSTVFARWCSRERQGVWAGNFALHPFWLEVFRNIVHKMKYTDIFWVTPKDEFDNLMFLNTRRLRVPGTQNLYKGPQVSRAKRVENIDHTLYARKNFKINDQYVTSMETKKPPAAHQCLPRKKPHRILGITKDRETTHFCLFYDYKRYTNCVSSLATLKGNVNILYGSQAGIRMNNNKNIYILLGTENHGFQPLIPGLGTQRRRDMQVISSAPSKKICEHRKVLSPFSSAKITINISAGNEDSCRQPKCAGTKKTKEILTIIYMSCCWKLQAAEYLWSSLLSSADTHVEAREGYLLDLGSLEYAGIVLRARPPSCLSLLPY
ncbi:uncharacterized protein BDR25DRAFT_348457 [Lindgomyces ingoldianus]|uniref:Uncharacterized protein n=1 Tax=Lindgomyces ingoldianus TaxID=673940 RepID=A0ACB6RG63_9PLEO|nr:uncharacterized protein BDR25DRAFT_348457 [Lindgomyces ingoldianus]KAF2478201.1 hypothetical protein BDR25DRAFT_348457 [Lindgomyces ingoldianus]